MSQNNIENGQNRGTVISRRQFLAFTGAIATVAGLEACGVKSSSVSTSQTVAGEPSATPDLSRKTPTIAQATPTSVGEIGFNAKTSGTPTRAEISAPIVVTPDVTPVPAPKEIVRGIFEDVEIVGDIPVQAKDVLTVDVSRQRNEGDFKNTRNMFTGLFADPGVLLFDLINHPQDYQKAFDVAKGLGVDISEVTVNPTTQQVFDNDDAKHRVKEGGFSHYSLGGGKLRVEGNAKKDANGNVIMENGKPVNNVYGLNLPFDEITHYDVFVRGLFKDGKTPNDRNRQAVWTDLKGGNALGEQYPKGAYVSEGYAQQLLDTAFTGFGNANGAEGARRVITLFLDLNTGGFEFAVQTDPKKAPVVSGKNY